MEIGNEISQKIRSAIKAKLVDLGVYVDDELPDYIMVMVANKKTQDQMTEDLNLFLGNNTEKFTSWLHGLLTKLQSITADPPKPADSAPDGATKQIADQDEDELLIGPEHDDFEEEANREAAAAAAAKASIPAQGQVQSQAAAQRLVTEVTISKRAEVTPQAPQLTAHSSSSTSTSHDQRQRREHSPRRDIRSRLGPASRPSEKSTSESILQRQRATVRKRRAPESVVGSIVHHDVEDEEEYDPRRPLIGRVASTVKVGDRRPTVPPGQQANKSLLLKAMTEARDSIAKATAKLTEQVAAETEDHERESSRRAVSDRMRDDRERVDRERTESRRYGNRTRSRIEPRGMMRSSGSSQPITRVAPTPQQPSRSSAPAAAANGNDRSVQLYSRSKREEVLQQFRAGLHSDSEDMAEDDQEELPPREEGEVLADNRHIQVSSQDNAMIEEETERRTISITPAKTEQFAEDETLDTLIESGAEESDFTDEEGEPRVVQQRQEEAPPERPASPKFVVTLDGIDPDEMVTGQEMGMDDSELDMQVDDDLPKQANIVRVAPQRMATSTPVSMEYNQFFTDSSWGDDESMVSPPKRSRISERCKFWLACRNGNDCPFHHPSVPCKMFPKCKFGDKCHYIHPNCRFDANCTRPSCPFTHATKRTAPAAPVPVVIQPVNVMSAPSAFQSFNAPTAPAIRQPTSQATCKFFPKCTNMNCKFVHPKPCRYGLACRDKDRCTYTHPDLPPANKLKWTAPNMNRSLSDSGASLR